MMAKRYSNIFEKVLYLKRRLHGTTLSPTKVVKYHGVYLDEFLSGETCCQEFIEKLSEDNGILSKARHHLPEQHIVSVCNALLRHICCMGPYSGRPNFKLSEKLYVV